MHVNHEFFTRQLFPERIQVLTALWMQNIKKLSDFFQDPQPFLGDGFL